MKSKENSSARKDGPYRLGIDLGSASVGWAAVIEDHQGDASQILTMGVRRFEAGVLGDIESGMDKSQATARRDARGPRRLTWRHQYRLRKLFRLFQSLDLLPPSKDDSHDERHRVLCDLDSRIRKAYIKSDNHVDNQLLPYLLRARALDDKLARHEFGRAL
jgi:CRISPR-associated endonuclease Csn1